jgi:hypothetical protein
MSLEYGFKSCAGPKWITGSHSGDYEKSADLLGYNTKYFARNSNYMALQPRSALFRIK